MVKKSSRGSSFLIGWRNIRRASWILSRVNPLILATIPVSTHHRGSTLTGFSFSSPLILVSGHGGGMERAKVLAMEMDLALVPASASWFFDPGTHGSRPTPDSDSLFFCPSIFHPDSLRRPRDTARWPLSKVVPRVSPAISDIAVTKTRRDYDSASTHRDCIVRLLSSPTVTLRSTPSTRNHTGGGSVLVSQRTIILEYRGTGSGPSHSPVATLRPRFAVKWLQTFAKKQPTRNTNVRYRQLF